MEVTYNPTNTTDDKTITWTSSDVNIATVVDGRVTAISAGETTITAQAGSKTSSYELTVVSRVRLINISLNKSSEILNVGQEQTLIVSYNPNDTNDNKDVIWSSDNPSITTVNNGKITAIAPGTATITATVNDKTSSCIVTVKAPLTNISLNKSSGIKNVGETDNLEVTYNPTNTTDDKTITWTSSNVNVATIVDGKVTATALGTATITATVGDKTATYQLTVVKKETLQEVVIEKGLKTKNDFIYGFALGELMTNIKEKIGLNYIVNSDNIIIATGVEFNYNSETFVSVVYGDLSGDGNINSADLLKMRQHLLGTSTLTGAYKEAGSIATGTTINSADLLRIRQHLLGTRLIEK